MKSFTNLSKRVFLTLILCGGFIFAGAQATVINDYAGLQAMGATGDYELGADITATGTWTPIVFSGNFDGKGHVIKGLTVNDAGTHQRAFIVELSDGTVKNLGIENANIVGADEVAAIVACANRSVIEGCYVVNSYIEGNDRVGAIVGNLQYGSIVRNCYASANVKARSWQTGGLVGATWRGDAADNSMEIINSYFSGTVTGNGGRNNGICGLINDGTPPVKIEHCVNLASSLTGSASAYRIVDDLGGTNLTLTGNYSLSSTLVNGAVIATTDGNYGAAKKQGENITGGDANAKTAAFYTGLGWNFTGAWKMLSDGYPVLEWQPVPVGANITNLGALYVLRNGESIDLNTIQTDKGISLNFTSNSSKVTIDNNIATASGINAPEDVTITISASSDFTLSSSVMNIRLLPSGAIQLATAADLVLVTSNPSYDFELTADINMSGVPFDGLCSTAAPFTGTFDGKGHVIENLTYDNSGTSVVGFFRQTSGATIKNIGIEEAYIVGHGDVGGIVGIADATVIEQCYVSGSYIEGDDRSGAIAGTLKGGAFVSDCYAANSSVKARAFQTGGLIGATMNGGATVMNSYFSGTVTGNWGRCCGILGLIGSDNNDSPVNIESCVNLASSLTTGTILRIADVNNTGWTSYSLMNNYSLSSTLCNTDVVPDTDPNYGTGNRHGANITGDDNAALTGAFYQGLGWDFDDVWVILAGSYPVFKWQGTTSTSIENQEDNIMLYSENNTIFAVSKSPINQIYAYDIKGSLVYSGKGLNASAQFNVNTAGVYVVKMLTEQGVSVGKVIVK